MSAVVCAVLAGLISSGPPKGTARAAWLAQPAPRYAPRPNFSLPARVRRKKSGLYASDGEGGSEGYSLRGLRIVIKRKENIIRNNYISYGWSN